MTIGDRIRIARKQANLTQEELGLRCKTTKQTIYKYETGEVTNIPLNRLEKIADAIGVSAAYLMGWEDEPDADSTQLPSSHEFQSMPRMKQWKVLGGVACGDPAYLPLEETVEAPADIRADFVFKCCGDSMINARIYDGDLVFIRRGDVPDGAIGVVRVDDEYSLKRIYHHDDFLELCPENPKYRPIILHGDQMNGEVIGRAVFFLSAVI